MDNLQEYGVAVMNSIPHISDVIWAAIIASGISFISVYLSNRNSRMQQKAGLQHDAEQRDREREMSLRRDVYLKATEAITKGQNFLIRLANLDIPSQSFDDDYREDSASLAKIHIVATNETVQAVLTYSQYFGTAFLELSLKRVPLLARKSRIEILDSLIEQSAQNEHQDKYEKERQELSIIQQKEQLEFLKQCIERFFSISQYLPIAIIAVRDELELPLDKEAYLKLYRENLEKGKIVFENFLAEVSRS